MLKTVEEIDKHFHTRGSLVFEQLAPTIRDCEQRYLLPLLGKDLFDHLAQKYEDESGTNDEKEAIDKCQAALVRLSMASVMPLLRIQVGGVGVSEPSAEHVSQVRQWVAQQSEESLFESGDIALEVLVQFLENKASSFPQWTSLEKRNRQKKLIISNAEELTAWVQITSGYRTYRSLFPFLERAEVFDLAQALGDTLLGKIKESRVTEPTDEAEREALKNLLEQLKPCAAYYAMAYAVQELNFSQTGTRLRLVNTSFGVYGLKTVSPISPEYASAIAENFRKTANQYLSYALKWATGVPVLSTVLPAVTKNSRQQPDNNGRKSFFV